MSTKFPILRLQRPIFVCLAISAVVVIGCTDSPAGPAPSTESPTGLVLAGPPSTATMEFGRTDVGSPFPPAQHDSSFHAKVKIFPRTVVIAAGGSVTFQLASNHSVGIYDAGTGLDDIDVSQLAAGNLIDDPSSRLAFSGLSVGSTTFISPPGTFDTPGRYLVICRVLPHFMVAGMYGWVIVQ